MTPGRRTWYGPTDTFTNLVNQHWSVDAACLDKADLFDAAAVHTDDHGRPRQAHHVDITAAKAICRECPVAGQCLQWALDESEPHGVLGGLTPTERNNLKRRRRR